MNDKFKLKVTAGSRLLLAAAGVSMISVPVFFGAMHPQATPVFDAASIKPDDARGVSRREIGGCRGIDSRSGGNDSRSSIPLGRCVINVARLSEMLSDAYRLPSNRISGVPSWDGPSFFDLEAKAEDPSNTTEQQLLFMLQGLLTERFKLVLHHEMKEAPIFALLAGKNASKLHASDRDTEALISEGGSLAFKGYTMSKLADFLSSLPSVGRPVQDMTGLNGRFDFTLTVLDRKPASADELKSAISQWDSILTTVQEQLGLRVESRKGSVDSIVIDRAEKLIGN